MRDRSTQTGTLTRGDVARLSAEIARDTEPIAEKIYTLTDSRIVSGDATLLWPHVAVLELVVNLLKNALSEADEYGLYEPAGRTPLRLVSDDLPGDVLSSLGQAA